MPIDFDYVLQQIGGFGKFQIISILCLFYFGLPGGFSSYASVFISYTPDYRCRISELDDNPTGNNTLSWPDVLNITTPNDGGDYNGCMRYPGNFSACIDDWSCINKSEPPVPCDEGYYYDRSLFTETTVTEFDLVCGSRVLNAVAGSIYMLGMLLGSFVSGNISDYFGRKPMIVGSVIGFLGLMFGISFVQDYALFTVLRCLLAAIRVGSYLTVFTYIIEMVDVKSRTMIGVGFHISYVIGYMLWSPIAYRWRDWHQNQLVTALVCAPCLIIAMIFPESARWLFNTGRENKGKQVVKIMAKYNGTGNQVDESLWAEAKKSAEIKQQEHKTDETRKYSSIDLFRTRGMRIMTLMIMFNWGVNSLVYYGISLNAGSLAGNIFLNNIYGGILEIGSYVTCILTLDYFGRKKLLCFTMVVTGAALLISTTVNEFTDSNPALITVGVAFAFVGKAAISASFAIIYNFTSELYPTVVRTNAMGIGSTGARMGSILAPFVIDLGIYVTWLPNTIFGVMAIAAGLIAIRFPETNGRKMLETIEQAELFYKRKNKIENTKVEELHVYDNKFSIDDENQTKL